jgi:hypothetical protein
MILDDCGAGRCRGARTPGESLVSTGLSARLRKGLCCTWGDRYRDSFERVGRPPVYSRVTRSAERPVIASTGPVRAGARRSPDRARPGSVRSTERTLTGRTEGSDLACSSGESATNSLPVAGAREIKAFCGRREAPAADNRLEVEAQIRSLRSNPLRLGMRPSLTLYWL